MKKPREIFEAQGMTPPEDLLQIAESYSAPHEVGIDDYAEVIATLHREKGLSFREIVKFLATHGVKTNRSAVYRAYCEYDEKGEDSEEGPLVDEKTGEIVED